MDPSGARHLAARLKAGVGVGTRIMVDRDDVGSGLRAGDRGVVSEITPDGVVVDWDRGFSRSVDPETVSYRPLTA
jgi:hypothetical protein